MRPWEKDSVRWKSSRGGCPVIANEVKRSAPFGAQTASPPKKRGVRSDMITLCHREPPVCGGVAICTYRVETAAAGKIIRPRSDMSMGCHRGHRLPCHREPPFFGGVAIHTFEVQTDSPPTKRGGRPQNPRAGSDTSIGCHRERIVGARLRRVRARTQPSGAFEEPTGCRPPPRPAAPAPRGTAKPKDRPPPAWRRQ